MLYVTVLACSVRLTPNTNIKKVDAILTCLFGTVGTVNKSLGGIREGIVNLTMSKSYDSLGRGHMTAVRGRMMEGATYWYKGVAAIRPRPPDHPLLPSVAAAMPREDILTRCSAVQVHRNVDALRCVRLPALALHARDRREGCVGRIGRADCILCPTSI